jgi:hypothetical protein
VSVLIILVIGIVALVSFVRNKSGTRTGRKSDKAAFVIMIIIFTLMLGPGTVNSAITLANPDNYSVQTVSVTHMNTKTRTSRRGSRRRRSKSYYIKVSGYNKKLKVTQGMYEKLSVGEQVYVVKNENIRLPGKALYDCVWEKSEYRYTGNK